MSKNTGILFCYNNSEIIDTVRISYRAKYKNADEILSQIGGIAGFKIQKLEKQYILKPQSLNRKPKEEKPIYYTISGIIRDSLNKEMLIGANVYTMDSEKLYGTTSDLFGHYNLILKKGDYKISFSFVGYNKKLIDVSLKSNLLLNIDLGQNQQNIKTIDVIDANQNKSLKDFFAIGSDINASTIRKYNGLVFASNLIGIISTEKGISRRSDGSAFFSVRGGTKDQNLILLDQAPVYHPSHLFGIFSAIDPISINSINVFKSDFPISLGGRLSSITDIRTKDGLSGKYILNTELSPLTFSNRIELPIGEKHGFTISYRNSFLKYLGNFFSRKGDDAFSDLHAKLSLKITNKNRFYFSIYRGKDYYANITGNNNYSIDWQNFTATIRQYHIFGPKLVMNNSAYTSRYTYKLFTSQDDMNNYWLSRVYNISFRSDYNFTFSTNNNLKFGAEYTYHAFTPTKLYIQNEDGNLGAQLGNADLITFYVGHRANFSPKIAFNYGFRFNIWNNFGPSNFFTKTDDAINPKDTIIHYDGRFNTEYNVEPRFAILYKPNKYSMYKASIERNYQYIHQLSNSISPFTTLDMWVPSAKYFRPQNCENYSISADYDFRGYIFSLNAYYKYYRNIAEYSDHANMLLNKNIEQEFFLGKMYSIGYEISFRKDFESFSTQISYTNMRSQRFTPELYEQSYLSENDIPHQIHTMLSYYFKKNISLKAEWDYSSGAPYTSPIGFYEYNNYMIPYFGKRNNSRLPDYHKLNLALEYRFEKPKTEYFSHSLTLSINNVYNRKNYVMISYNKIKNDEGKFVTVANFLAEHNYYCTGISIPGIFPFFTYKLMVNYSLRRSNSKNNPSTN